MIACCKQICGLVNTVLGPKKGSSLLVTHVAIRCSRRRVQGRRNGARAIAMYACRRVRGMKQTKIATGCGAEGDSARSSTAGPLHTALKNRGKIARRYALS